MSFITYNGKPALGANGNVTAVTTDTINTSSVTSTGAINCGSVMSSGEVKGASVTATGAISGASVTSSGAIKGNTIDATGQLSTNTVLFMNGKSKISFNPGESDGVSSTMGDKLYDPDALCIVGRGTGQNRKIHLWDNVFVDNGLYVAGSLRVANNINIAGTNKIRFNCDTQNGVSSTICDGCYDGGALCIVGHGNDPHRWVHMWDNVNIERELHVNGNIKSNGSPVVYSPDSPTGYHITHIRAISNYLEYNVRNTASGVRDAWGITAWRSDIRFKENIKPTSINSAISYLKQIEFIEYDWIKEKGGYHVELGVSAQQLQKIYPEIVTTLSDDTLMINTTTLSTFMVKAIQELNTQNETQAQQITDLQSQVNTLQSQMKQIIEAISRK